MSKIRIRAALVIMAGALVWVMAGCSKTTTVIVNDSPEITTEVSFSKDLNPLLTKNCATSGCHSGSVNPNLRADLAYNSLIAGGYVDTKLPENSTVYLYMTGKRTPAMPLGAPTNPDNINAYMLAWIKQGAKNN
jgi:hypothetical protein